jgi:hypothetical protein
VARLIGFGLCAQQAQAAYVVTVELVGSSVVATGAGSIDFNAYSTLPEMTQRVFLQVTGSSSSDQHS